MQVLAKEGYMDIQEIIESLSAKMIRRHPHIFGDEKAASIEELNDIWQTAKSKEGKAPRVKFEKVFADHFMALYDKTKIRILMKKPLETFATRGERFMRLDKYLKVSRLVKRRTLAKEISDQGRITINGNVAKAGTDVKVEDELVIRFGQKLVTVKVTGLSEHLLKKMLKVCTI